MSQPAKPKRSRGRPKKARPLTDQLNLRVERWMRKGVERYQAKYGEEKNLSEVSDAVRDMLKRVLKAEGLDKEEVEK